MNHPESYTQFIERKLRFQAGRGLDVPLRNYGLFPHQKDLVQWALRRGRSAIFADTGLGKSRMQVAWADTVARETGRDVLILAPLAVAEQTAEEGASIVLRVALEPKDAATTLDDSLVRYWKEPIAAAAKQRLALTYGDINQAQIAEQQYQFWLARARAQAQVGAHRGRLRTRPVP